MQDAVQFFAASMLTQVLMNGNCFPACSRQHSLEALFHRVLRTFYGSIEKLKQNTILILFRLTVKPPITYTPQTGRRITASQRAFLSNTYNKERPYEI
jgi:hypothetical protein